MKSRADLKIALLGMEELPGTTALRLRQAGYVRAEALDLRRGAALWRVLAPYDVVHLVYPVHYLKWVPAWKIAGKRVVFHWIGSDVTRVCESPLLKKTFDLIKDGVDLHIADAPWLLDDLRKMAVRGRLVPTISEKMRYGTVPMPKDFRMMTYIPDIRRDFYGWDTIKATATALPDVEIIAVKGTTTSDTPPNVRFTGDVDGATMDRLYAEVAALVRPTVADGLSQMVLEALGRGRQVVWSRPFPYCKHAATPDEFVAAARDLAARCPLNEEGAALVAADYTPRAAAAALVAAYASAGIT